MGITDTTLRLLVLGALGKQTKKPDANDLTAQQEQRRAVSTSLLAICGKITFPAHLMATYLLDFRDFYVSHTFANVHHFAFHPFKRKLKGGGDGDWESHAHTAP